ncbi:MAG: S16 family serine protease [Nanoarchaeota archaeon]
MRKLIYSFLIMALMLSAGVFAESGHMKLLAVRETQTGYEGGIADLYLEIKPGSGRVFLETFPLTKTDTQMSTRFAKAIACDMLDRECDDVDFFYTITADSAIIAGPSAGASIAVLTVAMLEGYDLNEDYAITGTINSGGLIGPVGGVDAKIEAAKKYGIEKVLIPSGEMTIRVGNKTTDLKNLSKTIGIEVMEASTLNDAVREFTGHEIKQNFKAIDIDAEYKSTMRGLANDLCDRSSKLKAASSGIGYPINVTSIVENAKNLSSKGKESFEKQKFYSSASYCFGANVEYSTLLILSRNLSKIQMESEILNLKEEINNMTVKTEAVEKSTITDLEAYIVVRERLIEAHDSAEQALSVLNKTNKTENAARTIAYASERIKSAESWSLFFGKSGKKFILNKEVLKKTCQSKISEADERKQYVELYIPNSLDNIQKEIDKATDELEKGNYELCLSRASKAKADVDVILSVFGVDSEQYVNMVDRKLEVVKNNIARQASKGIFPILGYSYYEYATSLKENDIFSAMLYSEYALELGNLDIYFKESNGKKTNYSMDSKYIIIFLMGVLTGIIANSVIRKDKGK